MKQITVTIPAQKKYESDIYINPLNCYLARELRKVLPDSYINVNPSRVIIDGDYYVIVGGLGRGLIEDSFAKGVDIKVTLKLRAWQNF